MSAALQAADITGVSTQAQQPRPDRDGLGPDRWGSGPGSTNFNPPLPTNGVYTKAKWDRTSNIVDVAKDTNNAVGCIHCHDPHGTQPRVVRDGLIQAIERDTKGNIFAKGGQTDLKVISFRDGFRK